jgi:hypothetical protein
VIGPLKLLLSKRRQQLAVPFYLPLHSCYIENRDAIYVLSDIYKTGVEHFVPYVN